MLRSSLALVLGMVCVAAFSGAEEAATLPPAAEKTVDYEKDIKPIFEKRCIECHGPVKKKSGFRMDTKADMMKGGVDGPAIKPGDSAGSLLVQLLVGLRDDYEKMPNEGEALTTEQIALIRAWVDQGAKMPDDPAPADGGEKKE
jgi:mono/diheme cytochrome c family protein